jgi:hypothetical protein
MTTTEPRTTTKIAAEILSAISDRPVHARYSILLNRVALLRRTTTRLVEIDFSLMNEMEPVEEKLIRMATWLAKTEG